jgi:hypothetical protein
MVGSAYERQPIVEWPEPPSAPELVEKLRALAGVGQGDGRHDFGTVVETFSSGELVPHDARWRSDLIALNKHQFTERRGVSDIAGRATPPALFRVCAGRVEAPLLNQAQEGSTDHV